MKIPKIPKIPNLLKALMAWREKRQKSRAVARHYAGMLADLHYHALHGGLKTLIEQIESGAIDDPRRRRLILESAKDVLSTVATPSRPVPNRIYPNQVQT